MNDFTIISLCIFPTLIILALVIVESYFINRVIRRGAVLSKIKSGKIASASSIGTTTPAILYGKPIEVSIADDSIHFICEHRYFSIHIDDFISIQRKGGKYIFRLANLSLANTKIFAIRCDDPVFQKEIARTTEPFNVQDMLSEAPNSSPKDDDNKQAHMTASTRHNIRKAGTISLAIGIIGAVLIVIISLSLYGKVYFYDGYDFTGWLWTLCFFLMGAGTIALFISSSWWRKIFLSSKRSFIFIGLVYTIFFAIFTLAGIMLYYIIFSGLFAIGLSIYIAQHYKSNFKSLTEGTKSEILEKQEKLKLFYSKVIAICLIIVIVMTSLSIMTESAYSDSDPDGIDRWTQCYKCNKTGRVRNDLGYYVTCPRCNGAGYIPD